jgi:hypothetical protein
MCSETDPARPDPGAAGEAGVVRPYEASFDTLAEIAVRGAGA